MADLSVILKKRLASRIEKARRVRTLEGAEHFGLPIGSPIPTGTKVVTRAGRAIAQRGEGRGKPNKPQSKPQSKPQRKPRRKPSRTNSPVTVRQGRASKDRKR